MKNIFKFFGTILTVVLTASLTGCFVEEDLESADVGLHVKVFFPTKVVAGQPMTINGSGFSEATEIVFPDGIQVTDFQIVSNDMIRVNAPAGIAAEGGKILVRTAEGEAESPLPLTLGKTVVSGYSVNEGDEIEGGSQITVYGTDLEFITSVEILDEEGNPLSVEDETFNRKGTSTIIFTLPRKIFEGQYAAKLHTVDGRTFETPVISFKPAVDEGHWETVKTVLWENDGTHGEISWNGLYRFGLDGTDGNNECIATFPAETWDIIKNGTFYLMFKATSAHMRITDGWWTATWTGADIMAGDERIIDNGDGTYYIEINLSGDPLADVIDTQHLLFTGGGYTPLQIYVTEEVWVGGGGSLEIVRTSIWKNDGSVGAASWSGSPYRFALETNSTGEEIYAVPTDVWEKMKTTSFKVQFQPAADWFQIRILDGWWSVGNDEAFDIKPDSERLVDNGDGTYTFELDLKSYPTADNPLANVIDEKHLFFAGDGFIILEMFWEEEVWVGGESGPKEVVFWENQGSEAVNWNGIYRFCLEGTDTNNECIAELPADVWDIIKNGTFYMLAQGSDWVQMRITDGWWSVTYTGADIMTGDERIIDNGDGTYYIELNLSGDPLVGVLDSQHLLLTGSGYTPLKLYYNE